MTLQHCRHQSLSLSGKEQMHSLLNLGPRQYKAWYGPTGNRNHDDERVHVCLYFLKPNQPMNAVDVEFMTRLQKWVPIVPVIGIADMVTNHQLQEQRKALEQVGALKFVGIGKVKEESK